MRSPIDLGSGDGKPERNKIAVVKG